MVPAALVSELLDRVSAALITDEGCWSPARAAHPATRRPDLDRPAPAAGWWSMAHGPHGDLLDVAG